MTRSVIAAEVVSGASYSIGKNFIINGSFDVWQRGASHTSTSTNEYSADRFRSEGYSLSTTISRQAFTAGQTDVPNFPTYYARIATSAKPSAGQYWALMQRIEAPSNVRQGQTYTLSYWIRSTSGTVAASAFTYGFGGAGSVRSNSPALTTTWQKVTNTQANINISGGGTYLSVYIARLGDTAPTSMSIEIANVKVEEGSKATDFEHLPFAEELRLCQRYFCKSADYSVLPDHNTDDKTICVLVDMANNLMRSEKLFFPVKMRAAPTVTQLRGGVGFGSSNGQWAWYQSGNWAFHAFNTGNLSEDGFSAHSGVAGAGDGNAYWTHAAWKAEAEL